MKTVLSVLSFLLVTLSMNTQTNNLEYNKSYVLFKVVEEMPRFPGCEELKADQQVKKECSKEKLLQYIDANLEYPEAARKAKVEGRAIKQFVVKKNGTLADIIVARDPGEGTGKASADVIRKMNTDGIIWIPGKQRNKAVRVQYTLPVLFKLEEVIKP